MLERRLNLRLISVFALVGALIVSASLVAAAPAGAQSPAICDQYPNLPQCEEGEGDEGDDDQRDGLPGGGGAGGGTGDVDAAGALPFTGYPLNALILLVLALLAIGLGTRAYLAARKRNGAFD